VGHAENGAQALELIEVTNPDIAIIDIDMPIRDGIELVKMLRKHGIEIKIIFLTIHKDRSLLRSLTSLGVKGYVLKDSAIDEIVDCVRAAEAGERFVSPKLERQRHANEVRFDGATLVGVETLTPSELRILYLISLSRTSREIANELGISVRTVETHRYNIGSKLDLKGTHASQKIAVEHKPQILNAHNLRETT
jgi:DNA-binding NarL/FixJ family response regulator